MNRPIDCLQTEQDFEDEISGVLEKVRALRELRNQRISPIYRLPPDTLSCVFEQIALDAIAIPSVRSSSTQATSGDPSPRNHHPCLALSHVCTLWRDVAIKTPSIWGIVYSNCSRRWFEFLMERAKAAPLFLRIGALEVSQRGVPRALAHIERIQEIEMQVSKRDDLEYVRTVVASTTPLLRSLDIHIRNPALGKRLAFPPISNDRYVPKLQYLGLVNCYFRLDTPRLSALRSLKLIHTRTQDTDHLRYTVDELFSALAQSIPLLRSLDLEYALKEDQKAQFSRRVKLPHLTRFRLVTSTLMPNDILELIEAPKLNRIELALQDEIVNSPHIIPTIFGQLSLAFPTPWRELSAVIFPHVVQSNFSIKLRLRFGSARPHYLGGGESEIVDVTYCSRGGLQSLVALCQSAPFGPPEVLSLTPYTPYPELQHHLCQLSRITTLHAPSVGDIVTLLGKASTSLSPEAMPFPSLRRIVISNDMLRSSKDENSKLMELKELLVARKALHFPVEEIVIADAGLEASKEILSSVVKRHHPVVLNQSCPYLLF